MVWTAGLSSRGAPKRVVLAAHSSRRRLLYLSSGLAATAGGWAQREARAALPPQQQRQKTFVSDDSGFRFAYPESWAIAIVRFAVPACLDCTAPIHAALLACGGLQIVNKHQCLPARLLVSSCFD